eukprot:353072-Chlamydomonas_euryale.AAC.4
MQAGCQDQTAPATCYSQHATPNLPCHTCTSTACCLTPAVHTCTSRRCPTSARATACCLTPAVHTCTPRRCPTSARATACCLTPAVHTCRSTPLWRPTSPSPAAHRHTPAAPHLPLPLPAGDGLHDMPQYVVPRRRHSLLRAHRLLPRARACQRPQLRAAGAARAPDPPRVFETAAAQAAHQGAAGATEERARRAARWRRRGAGPAGGEKERMGGFCFCVCEGGLQMHACT